MARNIPEESKGVAAIARNKGTTAHPGMPEMLRNHEWLQASKFVFAGGVEKLLDK